MGNDFTLELARSPAATGVPSSGVSPAMRSALQLLVQSHECALMLQRDGWDFAVEIASLRARHLNNNDLRWLVCKGYVEHACEVSLAEEAGRRFCGEGELSFSTHSCFILTPDGAAFAARTLHPARATAGVALSGTDWRGSPGAAVPSWHAPRRELWVGDVLVKRFRVPALSQERILAAFQEEGWPERIDDPLPPVANLEPKRRLHTAIHSLNRNQKHPLIHFCGDGSGTGVMWELSGAASTRRRRALRG